MNDDLFYEIEYDASPIAGVGKFVLRPQKIAPPPQDSLRERFRQMRGMANFYEQAVFMRDFEDDYSHQVPFAQYYPSYQMMGYEQLRTYFTWRTQLRQGHVGNVPVSYAFVYVYELLNHIGVESPQDGLDKLIAFREAFQAYDKKIPLYLEGWLKDYRIYYDLPLEAAQPEDDFEFLCSIAKYDIRKSRFFTDETAGMIQDCAAFVLERLGHSLFFPVKNNVPWQPFHAALFYNRVEQRDRQVVVSAHERYICKDNAWTRSVVIPTKSGRQLLGLVLKQMEAELRTRTGYKHKLAASGGLSAKTREVIQAAVLDFHREATKTVVTVDHAALARIRQQAQATQQALAIEEEPLPAPEPVAAMPPPMPVVNGWTSLKSALSEMELQALRHEDLKQFADEHGIMLEVLADGINVKAMDHIGDNLLDDELALYEDYETQVKEMVEP